MSSVTDLIAAQKYKYGEPSGARVDREPIKMLQQSQANLRRGELQEGKQALQSKQLELKAQQLGLAEEKLNKERYRQEMAEAYLKDNGYIDKTEEEKYAQRGGSIDAIAIESEYGGLKTDLGKINNLSNKYNGYEVDVGKLLEVQLGIPMKPKKEDTPKDRKRVRGLATDMAERELATSDYDVTEPDIQKYMTAAYNSLYGTELSPPEVKIKSEQGLPGLKAGLEGKRGSKFKVKKDNFKKKKEKKKEEVGKIRVQDIESGQTGTIDASEYDASLYKRL